MNILRIFLRLFKRKRKHNLFRLRRVFKCGNTQGREMSLETEKNLMRHIINAEIIKLGLINNNIKQQFYLYNFIINN